MLLWLLLWFGGQVINPPAFNARWAVNSNAYLGPAVTEPEA